MYWSIETHLNYKNQTRPRQANFNHHAQMGSATSKERARLVFLSHYLFRVLQADNIVHSRLLLLRRGHGLRRATRSHRMPPTGGATPGTLPLRGTSARLPSRQESSVFAQRRSHTTTRLVRRSGEAAISRSTTRARAGPHEKRPPPVVPLAASVTSSPSSRFSPPSTVSSAAPAPTTPEGSVCVGSRAIRLSGERWSPRWRARSGIGNVRFVRNS